MLKTPIQTKAQTESAVCLPVQYNIGVATLLNNQSAQYLSYFIMANSVHGKSNDDIMQTWNLTEVKMFPMISTWDKESPRRDSIPYPPRNLLGTLITELRSEN